MNDPLLDAGALRRFFARIFDLWLGLTLVAVVLTLAFSSLSSAFVTWVGTPFGAQVFGFVCIPLSLLVDAALLARFGTTPGKALLRLRVVDLEGAAVGFGQAIWRNLAMWAAGLALTIPFLNLITMTRQCWRVARGKPASYDEGAYRVLALPLSWKRVAGFVLVFVLLLGLVATLARMNAPPAASGAAVGSVTTWTNPENGNTVAVPASWRVEVKPRADRTAVHLFHRLDGRASISISAEPQDGATLEDAVRETVTSMAKRVKLVGRFEEVDGLPSWSAEGVAANRGATRVQARVIEHGRTHWRIVVLQEQPYRQTDAAVSQLRDELWATVVAR